MKRREMTLIDQELILVTRALSLWIGYQRCLWVDERADELTQCAAHANMLEGKKLRDKIDKYMKEGESDV